MEDCGEKWFIDEPGILEVHFERNNIYILFSKSEAKGCMTNGDVEFIFDAENNWNGICVKNVAENDLKIFRSSLSI